MLLASFFFSSRRRHTRCLSDWSSDVCSSDLRSWAGPGKLDRLVREGSGAAADRNQLSRDADGNLFRSKRAYFQSHRRANPLKLFRRHAFFFECLVYGEHFALAADHADVPRLGADGPAEHAHVILVASGNDHQVA